MTAELLYYAVGFLIGSAVIIPILWKFNKITPKEDKMKWREKRYTTAMVLWAWGTLPFYILFKGYFGAPTFVAIMCWLGLGIWLIRKGRIWGYL